MLLEFDHFDCIIPFVIKDIFVSLCLSFYNTIFLSHIMIVNMMF